MKLFIAVNLPREIKDYLFDFQKEFRSLGKFNFVPKKNYHVTLKFLGEIKEDKLDYIKQKLSNVNFKSFSTSLYKLGYFDYRVLWISSNPKEDVLELAKKVDEQLIEYPNDHEFNNHITIARIKSLKDKEEFEKRLNIEVKKLKFRVTSFELMRSKSSKDGSRYTILETYSLQ